MERNTRQRVAIRAAIEAAGRPLLPQEVLEAAQALVPGLGLATVYRTLKALVQEDALRVVHLPGENPRFEAVRMGHHHHFQCTRCQRVYDIDACPNGLAQLVPRGFTVEEHELTLYGRCDECNAELRARSRSAR